MDVRKLEIFTAVAAERSFTRAAERLRTAQSGVSTAIRALERDLGVTLLDRTTQRVELTEAGRALLPEAERILAAVADARATVSQVGQGLRGRLRLGILYGITPPRVRLALATFQAELPGVEMWLTVPGPRGSLDHLDHLREGALDLAVMIALGPLPGIDQHLLASEEVVLACAPDHPLADRGEVDPAEVADDMFIEFPPGWGVRMAADQVFGAAGIARRSTIQIYDLSTILDLVRLRLGVAFVPRSVAAQVDDLRSLRIRGDRPTYQVVIARVRDRPLGPIPRRFLEVVSARDGVSRGSAPPTGG
ncbi:LysR family transcriptional regulator [Asanoa siamensis]|uniref:Transcriptional regulator n=1 Tax=Asanoa siamensis TaxID=926357 RepID=A0ABQ4CVV9_9ACTN|nr:LysR family transcriptional regulator [Asanoa siamensis]GIF75431.1 transcriptional regulator [Asanoa siamensis]